MRTKTPNPAAYWLYLIIERHVLFPFFLCSFGYRFLSSLSFCCLSTSEKCAKTALPRYVCVDCDLLLPIHVLNFHRLNVCHEGIHMQASFVRFHLGYDECVRLHQIPAIPESISRSVPFDYIIPELE